MFSYAYKCAQVVVTAVICTSMKYVIKILKLSVFYFQPAGKLGAKERKTLEIGSEREKNSETFSF